MEDGNSFKKCELFVSAQTMIFGGVSSTVLRIYDRTKQIEAEKARMEVSLLNLLTANVSHEMITPLDCISLFAEQIYCKLHTKREKEQA